MALTGWGPYSNRRLQSSCWSRDNLERFLECFGTRIRHFSRLIWQWFQVPLAAITDLLLWSMCLGINNAMTCCEPLFRYRCHHCCHGYQVAVLEVNETVLWTQISISVPQRSLSHLLLFPIPKLGICTVEEDRSGCDAAGHPWSYEFCMRCNIPSQLIYSGIVLFA